MKTTEPARTKAPPGALEVFLLGVVDFDAALFLQERLMMDVAQRDDGHGVLLACEHPPLITIGREGSQAHVHGHAEELTARQMEIRWLNRGGGALVHVPGQLALYPILPLARRGLGLAAYRERLEQALLDSCRELRIRAWRKPAAAGLFSRGGKVAEIGVAVRQGVSSHGLFVNVNPRMDAIDLVRSGEGRASSLAAERGVPVPMPSVRESLIRRLAARLDYDRYHLYTGHPLLRRTRRVVAYA
ncbi:MAG: lipoyl(octanoyl) transferase LipB [Deltaproteobacteria bacterium]